jgi:hypothetical protein
MQQQVIGNLFRVPPITSGPASATCCMTSPANDGPTAQATLRVTFVTPLANVRSAGLTTAIT